MTTPINPQKLSMMNGGNLLNNKWINRFLRSRWYPGIIQFLQFGLLALGFIGSLLTAYYIAKNNSTSGKVWGTFVPYAVLMVVLTIMNVVLFTLPMAMRM